MTEPRLTSPAIRAAIREAGEPQSVRQLADATGLPLEKVRNACFNMAQAGVLIKESERNKMQRFSIGRRVSLPGRHVRISPEASTRRDRRLAAKLVRDELARVKREEKERIAAEKAAHREARRLAAEARQAERDRLKVERKRQADERLAAKALNEQRAAARAQRTLSRLAYGAESRSAREQPSVSSRQQVSRCTMPSETVEEWMARTGSSPVVLPHNATARPFERLRIAA